MRLVEKHIIKHCHKFYQEIDKLCFLSKNLYNYANYIIRQSFINEGIYLNYNFVQRLVQDSDSYKALPAKVSQQILMVLDKNWKSFFAAIKQWKINPDKFLGRPRLPKYKDKLKGRNLLVYTIQAISKPKLRLGFINPSQTEIQLKTLADNIKQVRIVPALDHYIVEVVYEKEIQQFQLDKSRIASVDIGLNNLAALTFNQAGILPLLINGKPLKSINQFFNKVKAKLQSIIGSTSTSKQIQKLCTTRKLKVDDYLHKASRLVINYLVTHQIGTLVIGKNPNWKQKIDVGKRNNQNFVQVPFARFVEMLNYKAELAGIAVIEQEESYTSKASFLDNDLIPTYKSKSENKYTFSGKRESRGLYKSASGSRISSDINGSLNIMKKAVPNAFAEGIEGIVVSPVRVTPAN